MFRVGDIVLPVAGAPYSWTSRENGPLVVEDIDSGSMIVTHVRSRLHWSIDPWPVSPENFILATEEAALEWFAEYGIGWEGVQHAF